MDDQGANKPMREVTERAFLRWRTAEDDYLDAIEADMDDLLEALQFYANPKGYHVAPGGVYQDGGERARAALAQYTGNGETAE